MLKIVMISPLPPMKTGESTYTFNLIEKIMDFTNIEITAVTGPIADELPDYGGRVRTLCIWKGRSLIYPLKLFKAIIKEQPHIVHVQFGPHGEVYGGLFGEPMIALLLLLKFAGIKTTITSHSTWMTEQVVSRVSSYGVLGKISIIASAAFKFYMKLLRLGLTKIHLSTVRINSLLKRRFIQEYNYSPDMIDEIPHPCSQIDNVIDSIVASQQLGLDDKKIVLVFGYIRRGKGLEIAMKAMSKVRQEIPDALLLVAGKPQGDDGNTYLRELEELRYSLELQDCARLDSSYIHSEDIPIYFSASTVILVPYTESIGASGPIHNNAGYAKPIVASDEGYHMRETLGGTLILFKTGNSDDLAEQLIRILKDKELRQQLGMMHRNYSRKETWTLAAIRTLNHYRSIIRSN